MNSATASIGICLGASTISLVRLEWPDLSTEKGARPQVQSWSFPHEGNPKRTLIAALDRIKLNRCDPVAVTGRKFRHILNLSTITEPEAVEYAYHFTRPQGVSCPAIVSAGGETFMVYELDQAGKISNVITGNKCASGTGEFFLQILRRMKVTPAQVESWKNEIPFKVSGRCTVFCKSDCSHATNTAIPKGRVTAGLCQMMAEKILSLLKGVKRQDIMLTGGTVQNSHMLKFLHPHIKNLIIPKEATCFEALGCALFAAENRTLPYKGIDALFKAENSRFDLLPSLQSAGKRVTFMSMNKAEIREGDVCILGLDVGSTTTKAVLIRHSDERMLESVYLRTNGDPIGAARKCYRSLLDQITVKGNPGTIRIIGLGVCGSGRRIAGLHARSKGIMNEITAHATAAVYFDSEVDTLFEIGGQDAKYTHITNGVPSDYAMNEACSAGTGSFLEESASETLGVKRESIGQLALQGLQPPNFNDQCAAFIASDIKNAVQEGVCHEDILAGLVYSVCLNYLNRVKGNRPVGKRILMQGGVCYNPAIPLAMATLLEKPIIVAPEPGLMGALGVALAVKKKIDRQVLPAGTYDLKTLCEREVTYLKPFQCQGQSDRCDRGCQIAVMEINGEKFPFGGACDKYYNRLNDEPLTGEIPDLVHHRQRLVFSEPEKGIEKGDDSENRKTVGINRSFLINTYYPLFSTFFSKAGFSIELPSPSHYTEFGEMDAPFCFPVELSHGFFDTLVSKKSKLDFIFMPHFKAVPDLSSEGHSQLCPLVQGEPYYLKTTFRDQLELLYERGTRVLTPVLDMTRGMEAARQSLLETAHAMGVHKRTAQRAITQAFKAQNACFSKMKRSGETFLEALDKHPEQTGIVLFGRSYNCFAPEANKGIPRKFTSRGIPVIPFDCLPLEDEKGKSGLYWGMAQQIHKGAQFVKKHPRLHAVFITHFSCGPDSFIISYFRQVMGEKPSLTLELDTHTADAGLETRIEAFLDIISMSRCLTTPPAKRAKAAFNPATVIQENNRLKFLTSTRRVLPLTDSSIEMVLPSMGKYATESAAAMLRGMGFHARAHPPADERILKLGRSHTLGKECLPMILTTGMLLNTIQSGKPDGNLLFCMPTASGPCRLGQYEVYMKDLITRLRIPDTAIFSLSSGGSYGGLGAKFQKGLWWSILISDAIEDIRSVLLANAVEINAALALLDREWQFILSTLESGNYKRLSTVLSESAAALQSIPMKLPLDELPVISLVGEIFARRDSLSRRFLTERLAESGFAVMCSPIAEWLFYIDFMVANGFLKKKLSTMEQLEARYRKNFMVKNEHLVHAIFRRSGHYRGNPVDIESILHAAAPYISLDLAGEGILTVGSALTHIASPACGVIAIGPFGCMPNRIAEAILNKTMNREGKMGTDPENKDLRSLLTTLDPLPFLAVESDGRPFSQIVEAKLEAFLLGAKRLHHNMMSPSKQKRKSELPIAYSA